MTPRPAAILLSIVLACSSCSLLTNLDSTQLAYAAGNAATAASLSDAQIVELSARTVAQLDSQNTIDTGSYMKRLQKVMAGITQVEGITINYKVYKTKEVNAFACGDGSIRVYSGLMDLMDDAELMAVIGHEFGHVVHKDTKKSMKKAYMNAAARNVVGSVSGAVGSLAQSALGDIAESYLNSQYSQKQEFAADDYGFEFAASRGYSPYSMYNALVKLMTLSTNSSTSAIQKAFSSHPDTASRATRMQEKAVNYKSAK